MFTVPFTFMYDSSTLYELFGCLRRRRIRLFNSGALMDPPHDYGMRKRILLQILKKTKPVYKLRLSFKKFWILAVILCTSKKWSRKYEYSFVCIWYESFRFLLWYAKHCGFGKAPLDMSMILFDTIIEMFNTPMFRMMNKFVRRGRCIHVRWEWKLSKKIKDG